MAAATLEKIDGGSTPSQASSQVTRRARPKNPASTIIVTGLLVIAALYFLVPVYWVFVAATKTTEGLQGSNGFWFSGWHLFENIQAVFSTGDSIFVRWFGNSLFYALVGGVLATYLSAAGGYALAKYHFRGRDAIFATILGGVLVPSTATALPLFFVFSKLGLTNTELSILIPSIVSPFGIFLCRVYAGSTVPDSVIESARLDGASELRIFHTFALRQMTPALVTVFLFQAVGIWNNYFLPLIMLADQEKFPITLGLNIWKSQVDRLPEFYELTTAGVLVSVVPLLIAMVVLQRFWRGGLTDGAVKG
ncbi:carbohydrate ABC transporter permease [Micrococcales bacterium 31B]|nr:carbohydrate ABC transporter permease [Micrococcales bacterium 31B]